jgi:hypothetical protein
MAELLLVNPRKRRKAKSSHRRARRARASNPRRRRRHVARVANPRRRHRRHVARMGNPRRRRRYARNPSFRSISSGIAPTLKAGAIGAAGALGLDLLWGYGAKYLPTSLATGMAASAAKLLGSVLIGVIGNKLLRGKGQAMAVGAATVAIHEIAKAQLASAMPSLPLGAYLPMGAYLGIGTNAMGVRNTLATPYMQTGLGALRGDFAAHNTPGDFNDGIF